MNKFACVALAVLGTGALVLASTPLDAKGGGGGRGGGHGASMRGMARPPFRPAPRPNIGPLSQRGFPIARNIGPLSGRYLASRSHGGDHGGRHHGHRHGHHHGHHHGLRWAGYGFGYLTYGAYGYSEYGLSDYGDSDYGYNAYGLPTADADGVSRPASRNIEPAIRTVENSKSVCGAQDVKVPGSSGETTVTILRC
jgi:hypothetical protein